MGVEKMCNQCQRQVNDSANFCENCGVEVSSSGGTNHQIHTSKELDEFSRSRISNRGQNLIVTGLIILCSTTIYYFVLRMIVDFTDYWELYETVEPLTLFVSFVSSGVAILIALGLKPGSQKTLAIVFASLYTLISLYWFMDQLIPEEEPFQYLQF